MDTSNLLDGTVEDVKTRLAGLSGDDLATLMAAEQAGKNRKGVVNAIEEAQTAATTAGTVTYSTDTDRGDGATRSINENASPALIDGEAARAAVSSDAPAVAVTTAASLDASGPADIPPATEFDPSGAPLQSSGFDLDHASLDTNPRANTTVDQNRIDFNDPLRTGEQIVADALAGR